MIKTRLSLGLIEFFSVLQLKFLKFTPFSKIYFWIETTLDKPQTI